MTGPLIDVAGRLADDAGMLGVLVAQWGYRDDPGTRDQAACVRAGHSAVGVMDVMLKEIYTARAALVDEIRRDQDATTARIDAMLATPVTGKHGNPSWGRQLND
jgi:hypothetical protein